MLWNRAVSKTFWDILVSPWKGGPSLDTQIIGRPVTSSYSSSLVHSFSDKNVAFYCGRSGYQHHWSGTNKKSQSTGNLSGFVIVGYWQSTNWIWFCCFNMFRPKFWFHFTSSIGWIGWVLQIHPNILDLLYENEGMRDEELFHNSIYN